MFKIVYLFFLIIFFSNKLLSKDLDGLFGIEIGEFIPFGLQFISIEQIKKLDTEEEIQSLENIIEGGFSVQTTPPIENTDFNRYFVTLSPISGTVAGIYAYSNKINYEECIARRDYYIDYFFKKYSDRYNGKYYTEMYKPSELILFNFYDSKKKIYRRELKIICEKDITKMTFTSYKSRLHIEKKALRDEIKNRINELKRNSLKSTDTTGF